jgi:glycosyltransferase involved in cell wall biosynthesis
MPLTSADACTHAVLPAQAAGFSGAGSAELRARASRMRVLALVPPDPRGQRAAKYSFLTEELAQLAALGVQVHAISPHIAQRCDFEGVVLHPAPRVRDLAHVGRAIKFYARQSNRAAIQSASLDETAYITRWQAIVVDCLRRESIDLIYSPFAWPKGTAGVPAAINANAPAVISLRGADALIEDSIAYGKVLDEHHRRRIGHALQAADHVVAVSRALADRALELGASPDRVSVILKGVDHHRFAPGDTAAARRIVGLPERPTILFVGSLIPRKGLELLFAALELVRERIPDVQLIVCGTGPDAAKLERLIQERQLAAHVRMLGWVQRNVIPDYFRACDVFVLPSLSEGSGNVLVEAAACAKPAIGTNDSGIPDYVDHGITGWLFEKNNPRDLADKLLDVLTNSELANRMGAAARERAASRHRYEQMLESLVTVFERVLAARRADRSPAAAAEAVKTSTTR